MSGYGGAHATAHHAVVRSPISVTWVLASALLIGLGIFMMAYWLLTFAWFYALGVAPCVIGGLMLFSRRAGYDTA
jgi:hypothetical protein